MPTNLKEALPYYIALQPFFEKAMGPIKEYDMIICTGVEVLGKDCLRCIKKDTSCQYKVIRLPLPVDPRCPERGLWGMVDDEWGISLHLYKGLYRIDNGKVNGEGATPELALLRALCQQEGIVVK